MASSSKSKTVIFEIQTRDGYTYHTKRASPMVTPLSVAGSSKDDHLSHSNSYSVVKSAVG